MTDINLETSPSTDPWTRSSGGSAKTSTCGVELLLLFISRHPLIAFVTVRSFHGGDDRVDVIMLNHGLMTQEGTSACILSRASVYGLRPTRMH